MKNTSKSVVELEPLNDAALEDVTGGSFIPSVDVGSGGFSGTTSSLSTLGGLSVYCTSLGGSFSSYGGGGGSFRFFCALN